MTANNNVSHPWMLLAAECRRNFPALQAMGALVRSAYEECTVTAAGRAAIHQAECSMLDARRLAIGIMVECSDALSLLLGRRVTPAELQSLTASLEAGQPVTELLFVGIATVPAGSPPERAEVGLTDVSSPLRPHGNSRAVRRSRQMAASTPADPLSAYGDYTPWDT